MNPAIIAVLVTIMIPFMIIVYNRQRVKGKVLCYFVRKDKSVLGKLCVMKSDFIVYEDRAYDVYPDFVRVAKFPMGWPAFLQELLPCCLYDEEDAIPLDWVNLGHRLESSMELKAALDENWMKKLVHEAAVEGNGFAFNWRRILPIALVVIGVGGLVVILAMRGCAGGVPAV